MPDASEAPFAVDRRDFLRLGAIGGTVLAAGGALGAAGCRIERREGGGAASSRAELDDVGIAELRDRLARGSETSRGLTRKYLARIEAVDRNGPTLRAVLETNPDAMALADALDKERASGHVRGPLHGVPVLIKDNIGTADRMTTTAGSLALEGMIAPADAFVARRLREAGAILLGKANLSEWANFRSTHSSSGWSGRGGLCRNPYALDRNASGSSSGSAAAAAASLAAAAIGTETDGSIVSPSGVCGVVGIKPTLGLVSRAGIVPIAHSQDTAGPIARTVTDAAILLTAMVGMDPADPTTAEADGRRAEYTDFLTPGRLTGVRIGVPRQRYWGFSPEADAVCEVALSALRGLGAELVDPADIPTAGTFDDPEFVVLLHEFKADLDAYLSGLGPNAPVRSLQDVISFNERNRDLELRYFGQELMHEAAEKGPLTEPAYRKALEGSKRLAGREGIDAVMDRHRLDALVAPTGGPAWVSDLINGDHYSGGSSTPAAVAGYPNITVPAGESFGLPVGLSFFGRAYSEPVLLRIAFAFEQETRHRRAPAFLATAPLR